MKALPSFTPGVPRAAYAATSVLRSSLLPSTMVPLRMMRSYSTMTSSFSFLEILRQGLSLKLNRFFLSP